MYEPYAYSLSKYMHIAIPPWMTEPGRADNWQTSAWGRSTGLQIDSLSDEPYDEHF